MMISVKSCRAMGLTDTQICDLIAQHQLSEAERKHNQRANVARRPATSCDTGDIDKKKVSQKERKKKISIPENWTPSEADHEYAKKKGWPRQRIEAEAERFRIHYRASGVTWKDWHLVWCKWVTSPYQVVNGGKRQGAYDDGFR